MTTDRRSVLKGAASVAAGMLGSVAMPYLARAASPEFSYKFGTSLPDAHPLNARTREAAKAIFSDTDGRVELQVFPNSQLGGDTDMLSQTRSGALEFVGISGAILSGRPFPRRTCARRGDCGITASGRSRLALARSTDQPTWPG
jgi:TRAP-type C4-dicarboxylate transport system substrate-binding protein